MLLMPNKLKLELTLKNGLMRLWLNMVGGAGGAVEVISVVFAVFTVLFSLFLASAVWNRQNFWEQKNIFWRWVRVTLKVFYCHHSDNSKAQMSIHILSCFFWACSSQLLLHSLTTHTRFKSTIYSFIYHFKYSVSPFPPLFFPFYTQSNHKQCCGQRWYCSCCYL